MTKKDKEIIIEFVDEDIFKQLEEQNKDIFISDLKSLELKYSVDNIEKCAIYLNEIVSFPIFGYYTLENGMFGTERIKIEIMGMVEEPSRQGVKCLCMIPGNVTKEIQLHLIEIDEKDKNIEVIDHCKNWYFKNH